MTDYPPSPNRHLTYSFSCLNGTQVRYLTSYRDAGVKYSMFTEKYMVGDNLMTIVHFYD